MIKKITKKDGKKTYFRDDDPDVGDLVTLIDIGTSDSDEASISMWSNYDTPDSSKRRSKKSLCIGRFRTNDVAIVIDMQKSNASSYIMSQDCQLGWVCSNWLKKVE